MYISVWEVIFRIKYQHIDVFGYEHETLASVVAGLD